MTRGDEVHRSSTRDPLLVAKATMLGGILVGVVFVVLHVFGLVPPSSSIDDILSVALAGVFVFSRSS